MATAEKLGRKWIGCDLGRFAIHTSRKRLIGVQRELNARPSIRREVKARPNPKVPSLSRTWHRAD